MIVAVDIFGMFNVDEVQRTCDIFRGDHLLARLHGRKENIYKEIRQLQFTYIRSTLTFAAWHASNVEH